MAEHFVKNRGGACRPGPSAALALILAVSGCYSYTQVSPTAAPVGSSVRVRVEPRAPLRVGEVPLPDGGRTIRGRLLEGSTPDTLVCLVPLSVDPASRAQALNGIVHVPVAEVQRLEVRRLQKGRTAAVVVGSAVVGLIVLDWAFNVTNPNTVSGDGGGGPNNASIPLFRLRW